MKAKQATEQGFIPLEYLETEKVHKPRKKKQRTQGRNPLKNKTASKSRTFPELKVTPAPSFLSSFTAEVPNLRPPAVPFLSILRKTQAPFIVPSLKFNSYSVKYPLPETNFLKISDIKTVSIIKAPPSKRYHFEFPKIRVRNQFYIITTSTANFFEKYGDKNAFYPDLRVLPMITKSWNFNTRIQTVDGGLIVPTAQTLGIEKLRRISVSAILHLYKGHGVFPEIYIGRINLQRLILTKRIPTAEGGDACPSMRITKDLGHELGLLSLATELLHPENSLQTPETKSSPRLHVGLTFERTIPKKREWPLPRVGPLEEVKIEIPSFRVGFTTVEIPDNVEKFINTEAGRMEGENLLSELLNMEGYLPKGASEALDKPIFVLLGQDIGEWHYPVAYLLSELYMEIKGEKPAPTLRDFGEYTEDAKNVDSSKEVHLMVTFKPWGKIEILDGRGVEPSKIKYFFEKIRGRLETAYLQGLGFFLIVAENSKIPKIEDFLSRINGISKSTMLPEIPQSKVLRRYDALAYALLGVSGNDFLKALEKYEELLKKTVKTLSFFVPRGTDEAQEHSFKESHQYPLKVAVFSYLLDMELKKLDEPPVGEEFYKFIADLIKNGKIKIEFPIKIDEREVIPDIIYDGDDVKAYIEIETLVGTEDPLKKIDKTINKYSQGGQLVLDNHELWIVLKPVSALIHYEELKHRRRLFKLLYGETPIKFKVLVYDKGWKLISIETFAKRVREALKETKELREKI